MAQMLLKSNAGFTVVELLVVITIIVVLLSLLAPAMDRAIYQAELAVCESRLKAIGTGSQVYAMDYQRHYPVRSAVQVATQPTGPWRPNELADGLGNDDR